MHRMEAEGDQAETYREECAKADWKASVETWRTDALEGMTVPELIHVVSELLVTKEIPEAEHRWSRAMREYISGNRGTITEFALRTAVARLDRFRNVRAGGYGKPAPIPAEEPRANQEGLYRLSRPVRKGAESYREGDLFQVLKGKDSGRLYAKHVTFPAAGVKARPRLDYAAGMIFEILASELVPVEEVNELVKGTGWCVFGHFLTNPVSIARGMGPKCYERYPHLAKNAVAS